MNGKLQNGTVNDVLTECYDPVAILLSSVNHDTENLTEELRQCGVRYNQLSGLVEEDLREMGLTNSTAIQEILSELSSLSNQKRLYDSVLRNEFNPQQYAQTVFNNSLEHVEAISCMIRLIQLKTKASFPHNVLLDDRFYASEFCLQLTDKINAKLDDIRSVLNEPAKRERTSRRKMMFLPLLLISGALVVAVVCRKSIPMC
uniref:SAM domain-containing protein n=1 Tax=Anopheles maculatus TaxID=74869 RepID=A0A182T291_9DIPT